MIKRTARIILLSLCFIFLFQLSSYGAEFEHIKRLFDLRESIGQQGKTLPGVIRNTSGNDLRTLERIFELNTSALTTVEAYFRLFKMAVTTRNIPDNQTILILNEWLMFIESQCVFDMEYLDAAADETKNPDVLKQINTAKDNIKKLSIIAQLGSKENDMALEG